MQLSLFPDEENSASIPVDELFRAYVACRQYKRGTANALAFEIDYESNLSSLCCHPETWYFEGVRISSLLMFQLNNSTFFPGGVFTNFTVPQFPIFYDSRFTTHDSRFLPTQHLLKGWDSHIVWNLTEYQAPIISDDKKNCLFKT